MANEQICLIVTAANQAQAQMLCETLGGASGAGMFVAGISPGGVAPATHFISEGVIRAEMAALTKSPAALFAACQQAALPQTLADCEALLSASDVSHDTPFAAMARLSRELGVAPELQLVN